MWFKDYLQMKHIQIYIIYGKEIFPVVLFRFIEAWQAIPRLRKIRLMYVSPVMHCGRKSFKKANECLLKDRRKTGRFVYCAKIFKWSCIIFIQKLPLEVGNASWENVHAVISSAVPVKITNLLGRGIVKFSSEIRSQHCV